MKPPPFAYHAPETTAEALDALAGLGHDGKVLAGGQSLIPLLNMRLAAPGALVDINRIAELRDITVTDDAVTIGAGVRQAAAESEDQVADACPLLRQALGLVAHPVIRNRGTVCGSIAHADPAGELTAVLAVLDGTVHVEREGAEARDLGAEEFFIAPLESCLEPGDLVTSVRFPTLAAGAGSAFAEIARRHGDYALCGVGAVVELDGDGAVTYARVGAISIHPTPLVIDCTEPLSGQRLTDRDVAGDALEQAAALLDDASEPEADLHASVPYRRKLTRVLAARALRDAAVHATVRSRSGESHDE